MSRGVAVGVLVLACSPLAAEEPKVKGLLDLNAQWSRGEAEGKGPVRFTHAPMRPADIDRIIPYGLMVGGHVCPIDHQYYYPKGRKAVAVYAPADGFVVMIAHRTQPPGTTEKKREYDDYALHVEHAVGFYTFFDLLTELDPALTKQLDDATRQRFAKRQQGPPVHVRVPVKAGQALGKVEGRSLDFAAINAETRLKGFLSPEVYGHYAWRVHVVDPFDHFEGELKASLLKLNPRTAEPRGGRIDFDIDGRLSGNWFKDGTGGYPGTRDPRGYWMGHLAFVRHHLDADAVIVSVGDFDGKPRQFGVKGNGPDPAKVAKSDGAVKYELVEMTRPSAAKPFEGATGKMVGVLLAEVQDGRALKVEVFPGATGADVKGFTAKAAVYRR